MDWGEVDGRGLIGSVSMDWEGKQGSRRGGWMMEGTGGGGCGGGSGKGYVFDLGGNEG